MWIYSHNGELAENNKEFSNIQEIESEIDKHANQWSVGNVFKKKSVLK